jgi:hypothetical protein
MIEINEFKEWVCREVEKGRVPHSIILTKKEINWLKSVTIMPVKKRLSESIYLIQSFKKFAEKNPDQNSYIAYVKEDYWFTTDGFNLMEWGYSADYNPPKTKGIHYRKAKDMVVRDCRFLLKYPIW